jgi:medium-chain acyl-[acyl-carrier-protein] hydrolase
MTVPGATSIVELCHLGGRKNSIALVCVPHAGGGTTIFRSWPKSLPSVEFYALGLPGREARLDQPPFTTCDSLVASALEAMQPLSQRPFALFGHSMGGLVAFEIARSLRRNNAMTPLHLFVSGFRAPHLPDPKPPRFDLPHAEFIGELRRINAPVFDPDEHSELVDLMLPTLRADFRIVQTYSYYLGPLLTCPITAFGGSHDLEVNEHQLREWRHHTSASFVLKMLPGGHLFMQTEAPALLAEIDRRLFSARSGDRWNQCSATSIR